MSEVTFRRREDLLDAQRCVFDWIADQAATMTDDECGREGLIGGLRQLLASLEIVGHLGGIAPSTGSPREGELSVAEARQLYAMAKDIHDVTHDVIEDFHRYDHHADKIAEPEPDYFSSYHEARSRAWRVMEILRARMPRGVAVA